MEAFLSAPRHAIVGTNRADGPPQLSPVWYLYEDGKLYISVGAGTAKHRNLQRDPRISICVDGCHPDGRAVMIYGTTQIVKHGDPLQQAMRWRIIRHYYEDEAAARQYAEPTQHLQSVLLIVTPEKIITQDFN
ncbi:MAG: PPOX class F420-dependent oxidoreductase [Mariprofundaceae bacterium]|nr:PPOX class F420-dependent oxidoreductase [Mariprofundaceae bacterium]